MPKIVNFKGQSYSKIKSNCQATGTLFVDPEFPAQDSSVFFNKHPLGGGKIEWKRPKDLDANPHLFVGGADCHDIKQGKVGNCWFIAAVSVLAIHKQFLYKVVPDHEKQEWSSEKPLEYTGAFHFRFFRFGKWTDVVIDDQLPTHDGSLIYAHSSDGNEFWTALLEKAYAKLAGSYEALDSGNTADALVDFTGGVTEEIDLTSEETRKQIEDKTLWKTLMRMRARGALMSCSISHGGDNAKIEADAGNGLVFGHAYAITDVRKIKTSVLGGTKHRLVRIRNPWGQKEWTGAWSDGAREWEAISAREQNKMGVVVDDDGEFFMSWEDFVKHFTDLKICYLVNTGYISLHKTWVKTEFHGKWESGRTAGGCINHKDTFLKENSQYVFDNTEEGDVMIALMQQDRRVRKQSMHGGDENLSIGFAVMKVDQNRKYRKHELTEIVAKATYINSREVFGRFHLEAGRYTVLPTTFEPKQTGQYLLRIFTSHFNKGKKLAREAPRHKWWTGDPKGVLTVVGDVAAGLEKQDIVGKGADPYLYIKCEGRKSRSPIVRDTLQPVFHSSHVFYVRNPNSAVLTVQVWNHNLGIDRFMGEVKLNVSDYARREGERLKLTCPLVSRKGLFGKDADIKNVPGTILLEIVYSSNLTST